jgi:hypothetical protein
MKDPEGKVRVGFFSFTEITDAGEHRSYNEWHQFDHMPEQFPLPGIVWGQRWVSTPACRAARAVSGARLDPIHYVTLYLMTEPVDETLTSFMAWGRELARRGRFHQHRRTLLSGPFELLDMAVAPRVLISRSAVPYRPQQGVYVQVDDGRHPVDVRGLCELDGVAGAWSFADDEHAVTIAWLDGPPLEVATRWPPAAATTIFAGPFETITPRQWDWFDD